MLINVLWIKAGRVIFNSFIFRMLRLYNKHVTFSKWFLELWITTQKPVCYVCWMEVNVAVSGGGGVCCDLVWCHVRHPPGAGWQLQHTEACLSNNIIYTATKQLKLQTAFTEFDEISLGKIFASQVGRINFSCQNCSVWFVLIMFWAGGWPVLSSLTPAWMFPPVGKFGFWGVRGTWGLVIIS